MKAIRIMFMLLFLFSNLLFSFAIPSHAEEVKGTQKGIPVLLYHHILKLSENSSPNNTAVINLEKFEEQMKYLSDQGYYTASISELVSYMNGEKTLPDKTVVITFDDGHKTNYLYAYSVLKKYGFKAVSFLITNRISESPVPFNPAGLQFLSWPEINEMKDVFEFGSHTHGLHYTTNGIAAILIQPEQVVLEDLETSRDLLSTDYLAYPFGDYDAGTIELLKAAGYKYAFTTMPWNVKRGDNPFELGRKWVSPSFSLLEFDRLLKDGWMWYGNYWHYIDENRVSLQGWQKIDGYWYYFSTYGKMLTGWIKLAGKSYYLDETGIMKTGWIKQGNKWYFLSENGVMKTGWLNWRYKWYYLDRSGVMKTGWLKEGDKWYFLDNNGAMKIGWLKERDKWYYLDKNGAMISGWCLINQKWYYFYPNGSMAANTSIGGNKLGKDGSWIR
ncbi:polysaccharide deacetylase family protein [Paenibacillus sp. BSR1-1]|uniref:polysaccharide deacetylase family protein n=1 Tax=Paenibacillus sp. BSR1-1 TaxID=3020845 RepID=UPI0025B0160B|nr:polysaccharide deacetylase family protein [Paenibacillus sp. BSR1-1]MDN3019002.1 polysaccharide deacetylase family protein [Paenibacillus sp. BSR1-1]